MSNIRLIHWTGKDCTEDHSLSIGDRKVRDWTNLDQLLNWLEENWRDIVDAYHFIGNQADRIDVWVKNNIPDDSLLTYDLSKTFRIPMEIEAFDYYLVDAHGNCPARYDDRIRLVVNRSEIAVWSRGQDHWTWKVEWRRDG
jgi:hypothetical protein